MNFAASDENKYNYRISQLDNKINMNKYNKK